MKKILLALSIVALMTSPVLATNAEVFDEVSMGAELDMPNLVKVTKTVSLGVAVGTNDLQEFWEDDAYIVTKLSWTGSLFDFSK